MSASPLLEVAGVTFAYRGRAELSFPDFLLGAGETAALIGPSGSGKSTLLALIAGLLEPKEGQIRVAGRALAELRGSVRDRERGRTIGVVLQSFRLLPNLTVLENLTAAQYLAGLPVDRTAALDTLSALGIAELAREQPGHLSRGQAQRAAIARAVVNRPRLILADEPTSSLDDEAADAALSLLLNESRRLGAALLIATHDSRIRREVPTLVRLGPEVAP